MTVKYLSTSILEKNQVQKKRQKIKKWQDLMDLETASVVGGTCWRPTFCAFTLCFGNESIVGAVRIGVHSIPWFQGPKTKELF